MDIVSNLEKIKTTLPQKVKLVAVSKFHPIESIKTAYDGGQRFFGESKMQEVDQKQSSLPNDIEWHFIGHLQTNKVKNIIPYIHTIHSVESWKLILEIEKQAATINKPINCLLEIHIGQEDSKFGLSFTDCEQLLFENDWQSLKFVRICGLMGMASNSNDEQLIRNEFKSLKNFFEVLKSKYFEEKEYFCDISMGMSHDYQIAIEEGSTIVRIGSSIFGERY